MYEFGIYNVITDEERVVYGYDFANACRRAGIDANEWGIMWKEYVD